MRLRKPKELTSERLAELGKTAEQYADDLLGHNRRGRKPRREYPDLSDEQRRRRVRKEVLIGFGSITAYPDTNGYHRLIPNPDRRTPQ